jgi:hypothetical protein
MASAIPAPRAGANGLKPLHIFAGAAMVSAGVVGGAFGEVGQIISNFIPPVVRWGLVSALVIALAALDLAPGHHTPSSNFQTKKEWRRLGPTIAAGLWGMHLGLGVATVRSTSALWTLLLADLLLGFGAVFGAIVGIAYGLGLVIGVAVSQVLWVSVAANGSTSFRTYMALEHGKLARTFVSASTVLWLAVLVVVFA